MSLFGLFNIGKSALSASQTALSAIGNNIANVNTPGFSRQEAILSVSSPSPVAGGSVGTGVTVSGIKSYYDSFIAAQITGQTQTQGRSAALENGLSQVEQVFNEANNMGLSQSMTEFFNAWNDVAANPQGQTERQVLLQKANTLANTAKSMESGLETAHQQANDEIADTVNQINTLASDIATLNGQIAQSELGLNGGKANDLRDQRTAVLNQLAGLTELSSYEDKTGAVTVMVGMRNLVSGEKTNLLSANLNSAGNRDLVLDNVNITSNITKGSLGGLISLRDEVENNPLMDLRKLIASVMKEVNILNSSGYGLDASTGNNFFNQLQLSATDNSAGAAMTSASITDPSLLTLDEYTVQFDPTATNFSVVNNLTGASAASGIYNPAGTTINFEGIQITLSGSVAASDTFSVSPLTDAVRNFGVAISDSNKIAASSSNTELPGNNTNALQMAQLSNMAMTGLGGSTFSGYYRGIVSEVGVASKAASDSLAFDQNMLTTLQSKRDSVAGVSLDEEATNLIKFQRSYEAAARLITTTDELIQTILGMK